jgi:hypothetical protein
METITIERKTQEKRRTGGNGGRCERLPDLAMGRHPCSRDRSTKFVGGGVTRVHHGSGAWLLRS